jgi:ppGpp synthetase/RelA/SpoT-type nucleotidyltranferase
MPDSLLEEIKEFLSREGQNYRDFLDRVKAACEEAERQIDPGIIRTIYTRADKQGGLVFKTPGKIAKALAAERVRTPEASPRVIEDIIGLTVVVHYPDEIPFVARTIVANLDEVTVKKEEFKKQHGYYAHHTVFMSHSISTIGFYCELQIKTMLHDAFGNKTHDLNYKPQGRMDDRLGRMMQGFGDALQSIEEQSELLRDLIRERWLVERPQLEAVRQRLFETLPYWRKDRRQFSDTAEAIAQELRALQVANQPRDSLANRCKPLLLRIHELATGSIREAMWLSMLLAMMTLDPRHISFARRRLDDLLPHIRHLLARHEIDGEELASIPLALDSIGESDAAIGVSRGFLRDLTTLLPMDVERLKLNLANFLVEHSLRGPERSPDDLMVLKSEVEGLLRETQATQALDPSALADLRGLLVVATADRPEDIREAIRQIEIGRDTAPESERDYAVATYELNVRIAWRRLLELEDRAILRGRGR